MAEPTGPIIHRRRVMLLGLESARGTAVAPSTPCLAPDPDIKPTAEYVERRFPGTSAGSMPGLRGLESANVIAGEIELRGTGSDIDPAIALWLQAAGWALTGNVWAPVSDSSQHKTITAQVNVGGIVKAAAGVACNLSFEGQVGRAMTITPEAQGAWQTVTAEAMSTPTHNATLPPRMMGGTLTIGGFTPKISRIRINIGNTVVFRQIMDTASPTGILHACVVDRNVTVELDPEAEPIATHDYLGLWKAGTTAALTLTIGSAAGNSFTISCPKLEYREIDSGDREGFHTFPLTGQACVDTGDDDISLTVNAGGGD